MFDSHLKRLCDCIDGLTEVAIISYEGCVLDGRNKDGTAGAHASVASLTPLIQQMKSGFQLLGLGQVNSLVMEGPNQKRFFWPINEDYLLYVESDVDEREGKVVFELSLTATELLGYF